MAARSVAHGSRDVCYETITSSRERPRSLFSVPSSGRPPRCHEQPDHDDDEQQPQGDIRPAQARSPFPHAVTPGGSGSVSFGSPPPHPRSAVSVWHWDPLDLVAAPLRRGSESLTRSAQVGGFMAPPYHHRLERRPLAREAARLDRTRRRRISCRVAIGLRRSSRRSRSCHFFSMSRRSCCCHRRPSNPPSRTLARSATASNV